MGPEERDWPARHPSEAGYAHQDQGQPQDDAAVDIEAFHLKQPGSPKQQGPGHRQDRGAAPAPARHVFTLPFIRSKAKGGTKDSGWLDSGWP
jgi:hypothetical protein